MTICGTLKSWRLLTWSHAKLISTLKSACRQIFGLDQFLVFDCSGSSALGLIVLIAPGEMEMPVKGWGAVELIVQRQATYMQSKGYKVIVLNSWKLTTWVRIWRQKPIFVINHYDVFAKRSLIFSRLFAVRLLATTHYAYAEQPERWDPGFASNARALVKADEFVALNPRIAKTFDLMFNGTRSVTIPNGVETEQFSDGSHARGFVCLGKVEVRKRQFELASRLSHDFDITFVGQIEDPRIKELPLEVRQKFVGPWTREQVLQRLAEFKALILLSDAEADALVLYEAQAAGLQVIAAPNAIGAQDRNLPWVHIMDIDAPNLNLEIGARVNHPNFSSHDIRSWASSHYNHHLSSELWLSLGLSVISNSQSA